MSPSHKWGLIGCCKDEANVVHVVKLKSVAVQVSVRGFAAKVSTCMTYENSTNKALEVEYRMPVDEGAAVYKFEAVVNDRKITAHCMEKKKAENVYKEAVQSGHTAVLAREDQLTGDILHLALGNLPAGGKAELQLHMIMELRVKTDGAVSFTLPTVLHPRYCPADITPYHRAASVRQFGFGYRPFNIPDVITVSEEYTVDIKAKVCGGHVISRIISHSDALNVSISDDAMSAEVTQDGGFKPDHDWGMLVYYANPYKTHIIRETGERSSTGLMKDDLIMINLFPEIPQESYSNKNEIIFIVDRSGSMGGDKIQSARATLLLFLKSLPIGAYFNVISFGSTFSALFPEGSEAYSESTLEKAVALQESMDADMGGTEILQPLQHIYSKPLKPGYGRQLLLLSDGEVFNVDQVKQLVSRHSHETRVFAVGIGDGASTALINGLARAGRGRSEMVYQQDKLQLKVMGLVKSMLQENVQDVNVMFDVDPPCGIKLVPKVPPVLFGGQHLILFTRIPPATTVNSVNIKGTVGKDNLNIGVKGSDIVTAHDEDMTLHRMAARSQITQWQIDDEEDVAEDMIALSIASGVVSRKTALVGVDQDNGPVVAASQGFGGAMLGSSSSQPRMQMGFGGAMFGASSSQPQMQMGFGGAVFGASSSQPQMQMANADCLQGGGGAVFGASSSQPHMQMGFGGAVFGASSSQPQMQMGGGGAVFGASSSQPHMQMGFGGAVFGASSSQPQMQMGFGGPMVGASQPQMQMLIGARGPMPAAAPMMPVKLMQESERNGLMAVVNLQKFDGSWTLEDAVQLTSLPLECLQDAKVAKNDSAWATALILALLETKYFEEKDQWVLLAGKARNFIASSGEDVDALVKAALSLFPK